MSGLSLHRLGGMIAITCVAVGCNSGSTTMPEFPKPETAYQPQVPIDNAYDYYLAAATDIRKNLANVLTQSSFFAPARKSAIAKSLKAVQLVRRGTRKRLEATYRATGEAGAPEKIKMRAAWRLLGRIIAWRVTDAVASGSYEDAIQLGVDGMKFAFDLTSGDAADVDLGCAIADEIRVALLPAVYQMKVKALWRFVTGLKDTLNRRPSLALAVENEAKSQAVGIGQLAQWVSDKNENAIKTTFDADGAAVSKYLLENRSNGKTAAYFVELNNEWKERADMARENCKRGAAKRTVKDYSSKRIWRRAAAHYLGTWTPMFAKYDRTLARTRLLIINVMLERARLLDQDPPTNVAKFSEAVRLDPFSGEDFGYIFDGRFSRVYSVGADLIDNGGETDQAGLAPDLTLDPVN